MTSKVFVPLRSNTSWFSEDEAIARFERLLKVHIAVFDLIVLEDGTYSLIADASGQGFANVLPPGSCKGHDRTKLQFFQHGGEFGIHFGDIQLLRGNMSFGCIADFLPIVTRAGLEEAQYFEWKSCELEPSIGRRIQDLADQDLRDAEYIDVLPKERFVKRELLRGFYRDACFSQLMRMPFAVDRHLANYVVKKRITPLGSATPSLPLAFFDRWIALDLPDFADFSWQEIHELHESPVGSDFRRMIERVSLSVQSALPESPTQDDLAHLVAEGFSRELIAELRSRRTGLGSTTLSLALNFIPYGSAVSAVKDVVQFGKDSTSWVSLIR